MKSFLEYQVLVIGSYDLTVANLIGVLLIWGGTWFLLRVIRRLLNRSKLMQSSDPGRRYSLFLIARYFIWTLAIVVMMEVAGIHVSVLLAGSAALLVGLGLGVQQIFRDVMSGIFLLFEGTIEVGDILQVNNQVAKVVQIHLRTSKLITRDGVTMIVPNNTFISENVLSWTHHNAPSRYVVTVGVNYAASEIRMREILLECALAHPDVLKEDMNHPILIRLSDFGEERMLFELLFWTNRKFDADTVRSDLRFDIRGKLSAEGISMAKDRHKD
jgi:small-conductance mechanosensitive channel